MMKSSQKLIEIKGSAVVPIDNPEYSGENMKFEENA